MLRFHWLLTDRRGPGLRVVDLSFCRTFAQICSPSTLRSSDEPSVGIGLRSRTVLARLRATAEPVSEKLLALELQVLKTPGPKWCSVKVKSCIFTPL